MENKSYIVAVDIGSSKVVVAVGSTTDMKTITVEAIVKEATDGVSAGLVDNSQSVSKALRAALDKVEDSLQIKISDAYACLSGKFVRSARYTDHVFVEDAENCISQPDLKALNDRMLNVKAPDDEFIMDLYPVEYKNDAGMKLAQPVGAYSKQLSATYNFILCERSAKDRLRRVFTNANISHPKAIYASGSVIAESLASNDEKQEGVAIVDIGCGVTDIAVYYGGVLCHMASLPIGSSALNDDIQHFTTNLPAATVEKLKVRHGAAIATSKPESTIQIRRSNTTKHISLFNLEAVTEARMTEIAEYVWKEIRDTGLSSKLSSGIILTGGGAKLAQIAELFHRITNLDVRVASAEVGIAVEQAELVSDTDSTLVVSLLLRGLREGACRVQMLGVEAEEPEQEYIDDEKPDGDEDFLDEDEDFDDLSEKKPGFFGRFKKMFSKTLTTAFSNPDDVAEEDDDF
ncbi:MAG: cell division protein FtsA [Alistipes sp.]|nr:cell division protein FtsA [Alistipes sp.]